jgi:hypothetical protein
MWDIPITGRIFREHTLIGATIEPDNVIINSSMKNTIMARGRDGIKDTILAGRHTPGNGDPDLVMSAFPLEASRVLRVPNMGARMNAAMAVMEKKDADPAGLTVFPL